MPRGTLEVLLVGAKGLENTDFLSNMDPYVILTCRTQEQKSSVASGKGSEPEWNESFLFTVSDGTTELLIKIMDSDQGSADDFVGEATIPLEPVFMEGSMATTSYNVVKDEEYRGEIKIGLTFTHEVVRMCFVSKKKALVDGKSLHIEISPTVDGKFLFGLFKFYGIGME